MAGFVVDDDLTALPARSETLFERADVGQRYQGIASAEEAEQRTTQALRNGERLVRLPCGIEPAFALEQAVLVREQSIERHTRVELRTQTGREQGVHPAHAEADDTDAAIGDPRLCGEHASARGEIGQHLVVVELLDPGRRVLDLDVRQPPVQVDREHREAFRRKPARKIAGMLRQPPHIVDQHDARRGRCVFRKSKGTELDVLGVHGREYTRLMSGPEAAAERAGLRRELTAALTCAEAACVIVRRHYAAGESGWQKTDDERVDDPVTRADLEADASIRSGLLAHFPDDGIVTEEAEDIPARSGDRTWIVDPVDGTREFVDRVPDFAVSIALVEAGVPIVAVVANPVAGITVCAARGAGSWRNGEPVRVNDCSDLARAAAIASRSETKRGDWDPFGDWFAGVRKMGSIAWKLSAIACGVGDLNISVRPKHAWDVCAGDLLVREAGGVYFDREGRAASYEDPHALLPGRVAGPRELVLRFLERAAAHPQLLHTPRTRVQ